MIITKLNRIQQQWLLPTIGNCILVLGMMHYAAVLPVIILDLSSSGTAAVGDILAMAALGRSATIPLSAISQTYLGIKATIVIACLIRTFSMLLFLGFIYLNIISIPKIIIVAMIFSLADALYFPAILPYISQLALPTKRSICNAAFTIGGHIGSFLGPLSVSLLWWISGSDNGLGLALSISLATASYLLFSFIVMVTPLQQTKPIDLPAMNNRHQDNNLWLFLEVIATMTIAGFLFTGLISVGIPAIIDMHPDFEKEHIGLLMAASTIGIIIGTVLTPKLANIDNPRLLKWILLPCALITYLFIQYGSIVLVGGLFVLGCIAGLLSIFSMTWIQNHSSHKQISRRSTLLFFFTAGLAPLHLFVFGRILQQSLVDGFKQIALITVSATILFLVITLLFRKRYE